MPGYLVLWMSVLLSIPVASAAFAQTLSTTADVEGAVTDPSGGRMVGATVTVISDDTGLQRAVVTSAEGRYVARALPVGRYRISVRAAGFEPQDVADVALSLGPAVVVDVQLTLAGQVFRETVHAEPRLEDVQRPGLGGVITRADLDRLPIDARNPLVFSLLVPGSTVDRTPQQGASRTSAFVLSGQRARANNIVVDGLDNNDQVVGSVRAAFAQDAVEQFQVLTNAFSAELGNASGGVVNIITRGGTNAPHGSAFTEIRDETLAAKNYFEQYTPAGTTTHRAKAPYNQLQLGFAFGGPLKRDRTFIFGAVERRRTDASNFVTIDDDTQVADPLRPGASLGSAVDILRRAGFPVETGDVPYRARLTDWLLRVDDNPSPAHRITVRLNGASELNENIEPFGGLVARSRGAALDAADFMASASHLWMLGTTATNEFRLMVARRDQDTRALDPLCNGECDRIDEGGPTVEVASVASVGRHRFTPTPRDDTRYQLLDTAARAGARHALKAGVGLNVVVGREQALPLHFGGRYIFAPLPAIPGLLPAPVSAIQALSLGLPAAYVQGYGEDAFHYDTGDVSAFVEDVWAARADLSVRYGLRYQRQNWPDVAYQVPGIAQPYGFPADNNNFAPRLAVSWSPSANTVVRGGYGMYYDNIITVPAGVAHVVSGRPDGIRTAVLTAPAAFFAWAAPNHRISEATASQLAGGSFPSVVIAIDPSLNTSYSHQAFAGVDRRIAAGTTISLTTTIARGFRQLGTIDYNPIVPSLGRGRRPGDVNGIAGTSASVLQYTSFGETWYRSLTASLDTQLNTRTSIRAFYTLGKAEDTSGDFQSAFLPQDNGQGRDPNAPAGLPIGFDPDRERGPSLSDQRHRFVLSARSELPGAIQLGVVAAASSGWAYNILAGSDLNGDGDGGTYPSDRARRDPVDAATSVSRNAGRLPRQATVDLRVARAVRVGAVRIEPTLDVFNLFNRTNFVDVQNVFGIGAYPSAPLPTFGQFTQAGPGRVAQIGVKASF